MTTLLEILDGRLPGTELYAVVEVHDGRRVEALVQRNERWEEVAHRLVLSLADANGNLGNHHCSSECRVKEKDNEE